MDNQFLHTYRAKDGDIIRVWRRTSKSCSNGTTRKTTIISRKMASSTIVYKEVIK